jgi:hypothetical protein
VAAAFSARDDAFGNRPFHAAVYFERRVFTPLSVEKPVYALAFFHDFEPNRRISFKRRVRFLRERPWKYFLGV